MPLRASFLLAALFFATLSSYSDSGCRDGTTEALQKGHHLKIAACRGKWTGHVSNATSGLCASGWRVCSWMDSKMLRTIHWMEAMQISGCYAFNAAQDRFDCRPCTNNPHQDNMAGIGNRCLRSHYGGTSCISGGRMEVTCCQDSLSRTTPPCTYRQNPSLTISGVICCKTSDRAPKILSHPSPLVHVTSGKSFVLSCFTSGQPEPSVVWLKDDVIIDFSKAGDRVSTFESGYLVVANGRERDGGRYRCMAKNRAGLVYSKSSQVIVRDYKSGCRSGRTAGLFQYENIHACNGRWKGHIKRSGTDLCRKGWSVCDPSHVGSIKMITWYDVTHLKGCYAYNAANYKGLCLPCTNGRMSGVGSDCQRRTLSEPSCLVEGSVQILNSSKTNDFRYKNRNNRLGCHHRSVSEAVSGVLCCRNSVKTAWRPPKCQRGCANDGVCVSDGRCLCRGGYEGKWCQTPTCVGGCIQNSECFKPNQCRCLKGYYGPHCKLVERWKNRTKERMNKSRRKNSKRNKTHFRTTKHEESSSKKRTKISKHDRNN